jgi:hypothetical protein
MMRPFRIAIPVSDLDRSSAFYEHVTNPTYAHAGRSELTDSDAVATNRSHERTLPHTPLGAARHRGRSESRVASPVALSTCRFFEWWSVMLRRAAPASALHRAEHLHPGRGQGIRASREPRFHAGSGNHNRVICGTRWPGRWTTTRRQRSDRWRRCDSSRTRE